MIKIAIVDDEQKLSGLPLRDAITAILLTSSLSRE